MDGPRRASGRAWGALAVAVAAAMALFLAFDALPFMDYPAHAGLFALRARYPRSPFEQRLFVYAPALGGYSVFRLLGSALTPFLGPLGAMRAIGASTVVAVPAALLYAQRRLFGHAAPSLGFVGLALALGLMTLFGFASFELGTALLLGCVAVWLDVLADAEARVRTARTESALALLVAALLLVHGFAFVLFLVVAGSTLLARPRPVRVFGRLRALAPAGGLAAYAAWSQRPGAIAGAAAQFGGSPAPIYHSVLDKLSLLVTPTLLTKTGIDVGVCLVLWALALHGAVLTVRALRAPRPLERAWDHRRSLLVAVLVLAVLFAASPHEVGWFGFIDGRLVPLALLLAILAGPDERATPALRRLRDYVTPVASCALVALALVASWRFQAEAEGYRRVFARVPPFARVLNLPTDPDSRIFSGHPFVHYDALLLTDRPVLVSDLWYHQGSAIYPRPGNPVAALPPSYRSSDLGAVDWSQYALEDWDYVLVRTSPRSSPPHVPAALTVVEHAGGWWLYTTNSPGSARASSITAE